MSALNVLGSGCSFPISLEMPLCDGELAQVAEFSKNSRSALNVFDYERKHLTNALHEVKNGL